MCCLPILCGLSTPGWNFKVPSYAVTTYHPQSTMAYWVIPCSFLYIHINDPESDLIQHLLFHIDVPYLEYFWVMITFSFLSTYTFFGVVLQMHLCRSPAMRVWEHCGVALSHPYFWWQILPSNSWLMKDWRGSWRGTFPERWARHREQLGGD